MRRLALLFVVAVFVTGCVNVVPGPAATPTATVASPAASASLIPPTSAPGNPSSADPTGSQEGSSQPDGSPQPDGTGSIAYILEGNVWLAAPDGSAARQLTSDGAESAYQSPAQAPDGSIYALRGRSTLVHLKRGGGEASAPVTLVTLENGAESLAVSPDGSHIAYVTTGYGTEIDPRFGNPTSTFLYGGTDVAATDGVSVPGAALAGLLYPSWIDADTLLGADGVSIYTADIGAEAQPWIDTSDGCITEFDCPSGASAASSLSAPTISDDASIVAYVSQPYFGDEGRVFAPLSDAIPAAPGEGCMAVAQAAQSDPGSFSPDGDLFAFDDTYFDRDAFETVIGEGIFVMTVNLESADCGASSAQLAVPGGAQPDWGPLAP